MHITFNNENDKKIVTTNDFGVEFYTVNLYDKHCTHHYIIPMGHLNSRYYLVSGYCLQDAFDNLVDYCQENDKFMVLSDDELEEIKQDSINDGNPEDYYLSDYIYAGNSNPGYLAFTDIVAIEVFEDQMINLEVEGAK